MSFHTLPVSLFPCSPFLLLFVIHRTFSGRNIDPFERMRPLSTLSRESSYWSTSKKWSKMRLFSKWIELAIRPFLKLIKIHKNPLTSIFWRILFFDLPAKAFFIKSGSTLFTILATFYGFQKFFGRLFVFLISNHFLSHHHVHQEQLRLTMIEVDLEDLLR